MEKENEFWDLIDENGKKLGIQIAKGESHPQGTYHLVIGVWTLTKEEKALVTKRSKNETQYPEKWENTGGCVKAGETGLEGAVRELREETGIEVHPEELVFLGSLLEKTALVFVYGLKFDPDRHKVCVNSEETEGFRWITKSEWESMISQNLVSMASERRMRSVEKELTEFGF